MDVSELVLRAVRECSEELLQLRAKDYVKGFKTSIGNREIQSVIDYTLKRDVPQLEFEEDWNFIYQRGGMSAVISKIKKILARILEDLRYECDRMFGVEEPLTISPAELNKMPPVMADFVEQVFGVLRDIVKSASATVNPEDVSHDWNRCNDVMQQLIDELYTCILSKIDVYLSEK